MAEDTMTQEEREKSADFDAATNGNGGADGRSIEDLAGDHSEDEEGQVFLDFGDHTNLQIRGKRPTDSEIKLKSQSRPIKGQLGDKNDDEIVTLIVRARLDKIELVAKRDGEGRVASKTRRHVLTPISFTAVDEAVVEEIVAANPTA